MYRALFLSIVLWKTMQRVCVVLKHIGMNRGKVLNSLVWPFSPYLFSFYLQGKMVYLTFLCAAPNKLKMETVQSFAQSVPFSIFSNTT